MTSCAKMLFYEETAVKYGSFSAFSGTLMLQLDGFPTGDGVKVKAFALVHHLNPRTSAWVISVELAVNTPPSFSLRRPPRLIDRLED